MRSFSISELGDEGDGFFAAAAAVWLGEACGWPKAFAGGGLSEDAFWPENQPTEKY